jgi:phosphatidyl-myo-inositol dimannoside synthase
VGAARDLCFYEVKLDWILVVTHEFPPVTGGIGTHCYEMAKHWSAHADVTVATLADGEPRRGGHYPFRVVEISRRPRQLERVWGLGHRVRELTIASRPDLIYSGHWRATGVGVRLGLVGLRTKPQYAQAIHGSEVLYLLRRDAPRSHRRLFEWTTRHARRLIALGGYQGELLSQLGVAGSRVFVSPEGADVEKFERIDERVLEAVRKRHRLDGRFVILTVGRLVERKGHDTVMRALPRVAELVPNVSYLIVGDGPHEARLRSLARELGIEHRVVFCGQVPEDELVAYYHACDVFAMISRELSDDTEGFGIVFIEAAACGKPTLGGRSGGIPDAIADGETGMLIEPGAVDSLTTALVSLSGDRALARRLGEAGRRRVSESYQYREIAASILAGIAGPRDLPD